MQQTGEERPPLTPYSPSPPYRTYVGNVVHAHLLALQTTHRATASGLPVPCPASGRAFFVTNGEPLRFWEFFNW